MARAAASAGTSAHRSRLLLTYLAVVAAHPSPPVYRCQALEHAFKNETVGLVSKAEFVAKRTTLQER